MKKALFDFTKTSTNELLKLVKQNWSRLLLSRDILQGGTKKRAHWQNRLSRLGEDLSGRGDSRRQGLSERAWRGLRKKLGRGKQQGGGEAPDFGVLYPQHKSHIKQKEDAMSEGLREGLAGASAKVHSFASKVRKDLAPETAAQVRELRKRGVDITNVKPDPMASQAKRLKKQYYGVLRTGTKKKKPIVGGIYGGTQN